MDLLSEVASKSAYKHRLVVAMAIIIAAMAGIETCNTIRIWSVENTNRKFPFGYVSKGIYSAGAFVRGLDDYNTDIDPILKSTAKMLRGDNTIYSEFQRSGSSFIYPPSATVMLVPFGLVVNTFSGDTVLATRLFDLTSRSCVVATIIIACLFFRGKGIGLKQWLLIVITFLAFYPLRWMLVCVQVQSLITLLAAIGIICYARSKNISAGILLGVAACLKPHLALLVVFGGFRRQWRFSAAMTSTALVIIAASFLLGGYEPWQKYICDIMPVISSGYAFFPNQSINGIVHRWFGHPPVFTLGPSNNIVSFATYLATIVFSLIAICPRAFSLRPKNNDHADNVGAKTNTFFPRLMDIGIALLAISLASPIAWEHHFAWTIVLFAACMAAALSADAIASHTPAIVISYILLGTHFLPVKSVSSGGWLSLINSLPFAGAVILLACLWSINISLLKKKA